jgi:voltage-gated potassium channel Kch
MTIDMSVVAANWPMLLGAAVAIVLGKLAVAFAVVRLAGSPKSEALAAAAVLTPAGEFAFVLLPLAVSLAIATPAEATLLSALAALTMLVGPLVAKGIEFWQKRQAKAAVPAEAEDFTHAQGSVLVVGFGRFGQMVNQVLLAADADVTVIDHDIEQIRAASRFGFKVYFGDGTRLDVLRAAGAAKARLIAVCIDNKEQTLKVVDLVQAEFPHALLHVRAYDRVHAIALMERDVDYQIRETSESALSFGGQTLLALGETSARTAELLSEVRKRDVARLMMQKAEGLMSGHHLLTAPKLAPSPLSEPRSRPKALSPETQGLIDHADRVTVE